MVRTGLRAALPLSTIALLAVILAACGGGGGSVKTPPTSAPDDHGDRPRDATALRAGGDVIEGSIDSDGDADWFRFEGRPGVTYVIRMDDVDVPPQPMNSLSFALVASNGIDPVPNSADTDLTGAVLFDEEYRFAMTPDVRSTFYIRITSADPFLEKNNYRWIVSSSEHARTRYRHILARQRDILELDQDGVPITTHPVNPGEVLNMFIRFGDADIQVDPSFTIGFSIPQVILSGQTEPETPAVHVHLGIPEIVDTHPSAVDPNENQQLGEPEEHTIFFEFDLENPMTEVPRDLWHALIGHDSYIDVHVSDDYDAVPAPLTSTPPSGGFSFFESEFRLTGDQAVPVNNLTIYDCTLLYLADQKTFQWGETKFEYNGLYLDQVLLDAIPQQMLFRDNPHPDLWGLPMNIRRGFPGQEGPIVLALGPVVNSQQDAVGSGQLDSDRDLKNIQRTLTDDEVETLRQITYGARQTQTVLDIQGQNRQVTYLGWYIEIEDGGNSKVRYDATLFRDRFLRGFEVSQTDPNPAQFRSLDTSAVTGVEHLGEVTFVTDYAAGGPVAISVEGQLLSHLNAAFVGSIPECGEGDPGETVRVLYAPGTCTYTAEAEDGTRWEGTVTIPSAGSCVTVALLESEAL